jgi:hypothetical protein
MIRAFRTKGNIGPWELHAPNIYSFVGDAPTVAFDSFGLNPSGAVAVTAEGVGGAILSGLGIGILAYEAYEGLGVACHAAYVAETVMAKRSQAAGQAGVVCPVPKPSPFRGPCMSLGLWK